jgi:hypothetical protein
LSRAVCVILSRPVSRAVARTGFAARRDQGAATTLLDYRRQLPEERIDGFPPSIDTRTDRLSALHADLVLATTLLAGARLSLQFFRKMIRLINTSSDSHRH